MSSKKKVESHTGMGSPWIEFNARDHAPIIARSDAALAMLRNEALVIRFVLLRFVRTIRPMQY